ncbi:MAG: hypothetical protein ABIJ05_03285 [Patescibacteria group bacterium]
MSNFNKYIHYYKKNRLLTENIDNLRNKVKVVYQYPSPRISNWRAEYYSKSISYKDFIEKSKSNVLTEVEFNHLDSFILMNKITPHAVLDVMVIDGSKEEHLFTNNYSENKKRFLFKLFKGFIKYARVNELYPYIAFNYEPHTKDRDSGQSVNRFHTHLIARDYSELNNALTKAKKVSKLDEITRRRVVDESTYLFTTLSFEIMSKFDKFKVLKLVEPFSKQSPVPGQLFEITDFSLHNNKLFDEIEMINGIYNEIFEEIHSRFFNGQTGVWKRPSKISEDKIYTIVNEISKEYGFTKKAQSFLRQFYNSFYKFDQKDIDLLKSNRKLSTYMIPLSGPCVNYAIYTKNDKYYLYVRPQLFSDLGGAGLQIYNNTLFKIKRNFYPISQKELNERSKFQQDISKLFLSLKDSL